MMSVKPTITGQPGGEQRRRLGSIFALHRREKPRSFPREAISGARAMLCGPRLFQPQHAPPPEPQPLDRCSLSMTNLNNHERLPDARIMHILDGKTVEPRDYNWLERIFRFMARPFVETWHHRDLIAAVLRRELRERFSGSMAGWVWALAAPIISLVT